MTTEKKNIKIQVEGMTCNNCAIGLKKHLEKKGFQDVTVNFATTEANCNITNNQSEEEFKKTIQ